MSRRRRPIVVAEREHRRESSRARLAAIDFTEPGALAAAEERIAHGTASPAELAAHRLETRSTR